MKSIVIYHTKTGFTERYARWLAEALDCECVPVECAGRLNLADYDLVLFGSWVRAGSIRKLGWLKRRISQAKHVGVFAVGAMPLRDGDRQRLSTPGRADVPIFCLRGGLDYDRMSGVDRALMGLLRRALNGRKNRTQEEQAMLEVMSHSFDATDRGAIDAIVTWARKT